MNLEHLTDTYYQMDEDESRAWGAYQGDGVEAEDGGAFRRDLTAELYEVACRCHRSIEVFACGEPIDAQDWTVAVIEE